MCIRVRRSGISHEGQTRRTAICVVSTLFIINSFSQLSCPLALSPSRSLTLSLSRPLALSPYYFLIISLLLSYYFLLPVYSCFRSLVLSSLFSHFLAVVFSRDYRISSLLVLSLSLSLVLVVLLLPFCSLALVLLLSCFSPSPSCFLVFSLCRPIAHSFSRFF